MVTNSFMKPTSTILFVKTIGLTFLSISISFTLTFIHSLLLLVYLHSYLSFLLFLLLLGYIETLSFLFSIRYFSLFCLTKCVQPNTLFGNQLLINNYNFLFIFNFYRYSSLLPLILA